MPDESRCKLGLALAGGGFRASLFHLGVLRRMAELDLLRRVEVLSTVSGGSIIGGLYILILKRVVREKQGQLTSADYVEIVRELEGRLSRGVKLNLRNALFWNPIGVLGMMLTPHTMAKRMANIYERYLYRGVVDQLVESGAVTDTRPWWKRLLWPGRIRLKDIRPDPRPTAPPGGIEAYNSQQVGELDSSGCAVTQLMLNATTLNSGSKFLFSSSEIGDWYLGHVRHSEVERLLKYRRLLRSLPSSMSYTAVAALPDEPVSVGESEFPRRIVLLALWLRDRGQHYPSHFAAGDWQPIFANLPGLPGALAEVDFGRFRYAKLPAWYLLKGSRDFDPPVWGGLSKEEHEQRLYENLRGINGVGDDLRKTIVSFANTHAANRDLLLDLILELYWLRSAQIVSGRIGTDWEKLTLGDAVGASACFPPVFPPMTFFGIYDDAHVARLGLTDGGVFDNTGVTTLIDERCNYIISSDTSGVFHILQSASNSRTRLPERIMNILMRDLGSWRRQILRERRRTSRMLDAVADRHGAVLENAPDDVRSVVEELDEGLSDFHSTRRLRGLAYFHIHSPPIPGRSGPQLAVDRTALAEIRTDLDGFGDAEIAALQNHGYLTADAYMREYLTDFKPAESNEMWGADLELPGTLPDDTTLVKIINVGKQRFFRALGLRAAVSWLWTLAAVAAGLWLVSRVTLDLGEAMSSGPRWLARLTLWDGWMELPVRWLVLGLAAAGVLVFVGTRLFGRSASVEDAQKAAPVDDRTLGRLIGSTGKYLRGFSGLLLFVFGLLPLFLVAAVTVYAWINWLFFHLPFRSATKVGRPHGS